jgi:hypothetical protein
MSTLRPVTMLAKGIAQRAEAPGPVRSSFHYAHSDCIVYMIARAPASFPGEGCHPTAL